MKTTIEFDNDDNSELQFFLKSRDFYCALFNIEQLIRSYHKHGEYHETLEGFRKASDELLQSIRDEISESGMTEMP